MIKTDQRRLLKISSLFPTVNRMSPQHAPGNSTHSLGDEVDEVVSGFVVAGIQSVECVLQPFRSCVFTHGRYLTGRLISFAKAAGS